MTEVQTLLPGVMSRGNSPESSSVASTSNIGSFGGATTDLKRPRRGTTNSEQLGDESSNQTSVKRHKTDDSENGKNGRLLACPYYKRSPDLYQGHGRACAGPGWGTCHRVK